MINLYTFTPKVFNNVFSDDTYKKIYAAVNSIFPETLSADVPEDAEYRNVQDLGYFAIPVSGYNFGSEVFAEVQAVTETMLGFKVQRPEIHFARYTKKTGADPILRPHYDRMLEHPSITMSVQLDGTMPWAIGAYNTTEMISSNDGLLFSGSHQVHWRPKNTFGDDDYFDILVCQMAISNEKLTQEHVDKMAIAVNEHATKIWPFM